MRLRIYFEQMHNASQTNNASSKINTAIIAAFFSSVSAKTFTAPHITVFVKVPTSILLIGMSSTKNIH